jgi:hypothetical protein
VQELIEIGEVLQCAQEINMQLDLLSEVESIEGLILDLMECNTNTLSSRTTVEDNRQ